MVKDGYSFMMSYMEFPIMGEGAAIDTACYQIKTLVPGKGYLIFLS